MARFKTSQDNEQLTLNNLEGCTVAHNTMPALILILRNIKKNVESIQTKGLPQGSVKRLPGARRESLTFPPDDPGSARLFSGAGGITQSARFSRCECYGELPEQSRNSFLLSPALQGP